MNADSLSNGTNTPASASPGALPIPPGVVPPPPGLGAVPAPPAVVAPPPGPGVQPPFVAPPTDGARQRRWLAVGLAGAAALVVCVGGLFGLGGLVVFGGQMIIDQARTAVVDYLTAIQNEEYGEAYAQLCDAKRASIDEDEFLLTFAGDPGITSFTVSEPNLTGDRTVVPATVRYTNGVSDTVSYVLEQDTSTGEFEVCGEED